MIGQPAPEYRIQLGDEDITPRFTPRLISLTLTDKRGMEADELDLQLDDSDGALALPARGVELRVWIGWAGAALTDKGRYTVDEIEHSGAPDVLNIRARSADLADGSLTTKKERSWHEVTLGNLVRSIAQDAGLQPAIGPALDGERIEHLDQTNESDAHLLTRLAQRYDAVATVKAGRLLFMPAGAGTSTSGQPLPVLTITRRDGDHHRYGLTDRNTYTGVIAYWHDLKTAKRSKVQVGKPKWHRHAVKVGTDGYRKHLRETYATKEEAEKAAAAELERLKRGGANLSLTLALGQPELFPEMPARTLGWKPEIDATEWIVKEVRHQIGDGGFVTEVELETKGMDAGDDSTEETGSEPEAAED